MARPPKNGISSSVTHAAGSTLRVNKRTSQGVAASLKKGEKTKKEMAAIVAATRTQASVQEQPKQSAVSFSKFCAQHLSLKLTPGQSVVAKLAFGNEPISSLTEEELEIAEVMLGASLQELEISPEHRRLVVLSLGRGSGKTTICSAFCIYQALLGDASRCGPGDVPVAVIVAPQKDTAKLSIRMASEMLQASPALKGLLVSVERELITVKRPDGRKAAIEAFAASRGGATVRGRSIISFLLDEAEFFQSGEGEGEFAVNDRAVFQALIPRLLPQGKAMLISTPWPTPTLMSELIEENFGRPKSALVFIAPTPLMRPDPETEKLVEQELVRSPANARREFYCERNSENFHAFLDASKLGEKIQAVDDKPAHLWTYSACADFGFKRDSSSLAIVGFDGSRYHIVNMQSLMPKNGVPLKPSEVVESFSATLNKYGLKSVWADSFYQEAIRESLSKHGIFLNSLPEGAGGKQDMYARTKAVLDDGRVDCNSSAELTSLKAQLPLVTAKASVGGRLSIRTARRKNMGHGDLVSAVVGAIWSLAYAYAKSEEPVKPIFGEPGYEEWKAQAISKAEERREKEHLAKLDKRASFQSSRGATASLSRFLDGRRFR